MMLTVLGEAVWQPYGLKKTTTGPGTSTTCPLVDNPRVEPDGAPHRRIDLE